MESFGFETADGDVLVQDNEAETNVEHREEHRTLTAGDIVAMTVKNSCGGLGYVLRTDGSQATVAPLQYIKGKWVRSGQSRTKTFEYFTKIPPLESMQIVV